MLQSDNIIPVFEHDVSGAIYTIAITVYKRSLFLKQCIESAIHQNTQVPYEIIIVNDDPENNNQVDILMNEYQRTSNISYFKKKANEGLMDNMNRGIMLSRSDWVLLIHDDDWLCPNYLQIIEEYRNRHPQYTIFVPSHTTYYFGKFVETKSKLREFICRIKGCWEIKPIDFINGTCATPTGTLYHKKSFIKSGGFAKRYGMAADYVFFSLYSSEYKILRINEKLFHYRFAENESLKPETIANFKLIGHYLSVFLMERHTRVCKSIRLLYEKVRLWRDYNGVTEEIRCAIGDKEFCKYQKVAYLPIVFHLINLYSKISVFLR